MKNETKYWFFISVLSVLFLLAAERIAAAPTIESETSAAIPTTGGMDNGVFLTGGPGFALLSGDIGWSLNAGALVQVQADSPVFVGADLALNFWNQTAPSIGPGFNASTGATGLQLLPTAIYRFNVASAKHFFPYLGLSLGPHIYFHRDVVANNVTFQQGYTSVYFEALLRPGFFLGITDQIALNLEPKLGILKDMFIFLPSVNGVFHL